MADVVRPFQPIGASLSIAATTSTGSAALTGTSNRRHCLVYNPGTTLAFVKFGTSAVTADLTSMPIPPGAYFCLYAGDATHIAAIMATGTATIYAQPGLGE